MQYKGRVLKKVWDKRLLLYVEGNGRQHKDS